MWIFSPHLFSVLGFVLAIVLTVRLMREHRAPGSTMAWGLAMVLIPYIGVPLFLLFGGRKIRRLAEDKYPLYGGQGIRSEGDPYPNDTERILAVCGAPPPTPGNSTELLVDGVVTFMRLLEILENAKRTIHITTFILGRDEVGRKIIKVLSRKAREGVEVRLLLDALGSLKTRGRFCQPLRDAGGKVGIFMPMLPLHRKWSANLRNHRKVVIVDDKVGMIGGMNLAKEYMGPTHDPKRWHDLGMILHGPSVADVAKIFASDWYFATNEPILLAPPVAATAGRPISLQVVASGPDVYTDPYYQALLTLISGAKERIWLVSPYFIPDDVLTKNLALAAKLGRDVRVLVPKVSNHYAADLARGSYIRELRQAGVKFYAYLEGMIHTKVLIVDNGQGVVGSANMDMRSLYLNYEIALFIHDEKEVQRLAGTISDLLGHSEPMSAGKVAWKRLIKEWIEDASRVLAPLL